jgi:hypothetical protein
MYLPMAQCVLEKFAKKLFGESEVETVLQRLDRLTQDEARMTVTQTLGVVHRLVGHVRVVMEGMQRLHDLDIFLSACCILVLDGRASTDSIRQALGKCLTMNTYILCSSG